MAIAPYDLGAGLDSRGWSSALYDDAQRRLEEDARLRAEEDARRLAEEQARQAAEEEARRRAEEDARRTAEQGQRQAFDRASLAPPSPTLGDLMRPDPALSYSPGEAGPSVAPPEMKPGEPMEGPRTYSAGAGGVQEVPRDTTAHPITGAELEAMGGNPHIQGATSYYGGSAFPTGTPSPTRKTSEMSLDRFNDEIRHSELYQQFIHDRGLWAPGGRVVEWKEKDRDDWKRLLEQHGVQVDGGMKIDNAGNINQKNMLGKTLAKIGIIAGGIGATVLTGGAASPWLATSIGAGTGAATGAIDAGLKGALIGAGVGGAGGYLMGGGRVPGLGGGGGVGKDVANVASQVTKNAVKDGVTQAGGNMLGGALPQVISGLAGLGTAYMGQKAQTQAANRAAEASERGAAASERTITAQMEFEREQRAQERADAERRWAAEQDMARKMWEAQEEERMFRRQILLEDRAARGGGGSAPRGPSIEEIRKQQRRDQARRNLDALLAQGSPSAGGGYVPATAAGPVGRV